MSQGLTSWCGIACVVLLWPSLCLGQRKSGCTTGSGTTSSSSSVARGPSLPGSSGPGSPSLRTPTGPGGFQTPMTGRRGLQPGTPWSPPQPNLQMALQQNLRFQQALTQQMHQQWLLQDQLKQQLLRFALEAPAENLRRELNNSNAFVRWAASVELNRRWRLENALREPSATTGVVRTAAAAPATSIRLRSATPAVVTRIDPKLELRYGIPAP
ncbi:MAG: hypothetical protein L0Y71_01605 [Gemmataceae bacterium]|nr:hypothetical protein [Gemmataceae bacterium]